MPQGYRFSDALPGLAQRFIQGQVNVKEDQDATDSRGYP